MNRLPNLAAALAAGLCFPAVATAQAAKPCVTPIESEAVVSYLLPPLVTGIAGACQQSLGPDAYIEREAPRLSDRLRPAAHNAWPAARAAVQRVAKLPLPPEIMGDAAEGAIGPILAAGIAGQANPDTCRTADRLLAALDPLPPRNLAQAMALFLELGVAKDDKAPFRICS